MKIQEYSYPSATGVCRIAAFSYRPDDDRFDTVLVLHHGMAEHHRRYEGFIEYLCANGVAVYTHDMANHGASNEDPAETGWFGPKDGDRGLIKDFCTNVRKAMKENPGKKVFVMGHSMGSFICRMYTTTFPQDPIAGAIFMGTGGPNYMASAGKPVAQSVGIALGKKSKSLLLDKLAFGTYNDHFEKRTKFDWLTRDSAVVDAYIADPCCGFLFTAQGMADLIALNIASNHKSWFRNLAKELPILLISGADDPVGDYGKGITAIKKNLTATGHTQVTVRLYPECRHEILNELNRDTVRQDLLQWIRETAEA